MNVMRSSAWSKFMLSEGKDERDEVVCMVKRNR